MLICKFFICKMLRDIVLTRCNINIGFTTIIIIIIIIIVIIIIMLQLVNLYTACTFTAWQTAQQLTLLIINNQETLIKHIALKMFLLCNISSSQLNVKEWILMNHITRWLRISSRAQRRSCYQKVVGSNPLVCISKCSWARCWTWNCSWCAGRHLG